ncbi:MAG: hypothetical protein K6E95_05690, partial [Lachnospiraceae bacterium]|nr:hypothetical protein [Lachnospiraceae bacterium]
MITPGIKVSADETTVTLPQNVFRDETPDTNGIPKYFHKGEKYRELNDIEKKAFDQIILLHLYLIKDSDNNDEYHHFEQYFGDFLGSLNEWVTYKNGVFTVNLNSENDQKVSQLKMPEISGIKVVKTEAASGTAVTYYRANEANNKDFETKFSAELAKQYSLGKVVDALAIDIPDLFWWDKAKGINDKYGIQNEGTDALKVSGFEFEVYCSKNSGNEHYSEETIKDTYSDIFSFTEGIRYGVGKPQFWKILNEYNSYINIPSALSDYDKLRGVALMLGKIMQYDDKYNFESGDSSEVRPTSYGIDCITSVN